MVNNRPTKWCQMDIYIRWGCQTTGDERQLNIMTDNGGLQSFGN